MLVILTEDIKGVGKKGETINASDGHARNYLFPKNLAIEATKSNIAHLANLKKAQENKKQQEVDEARELAKKIEEKVIKIAVKMGDNGKLFGSVTNKEISTALEEQNSLKIDKKKIVLSEPIKNIGAKKVEVKLHPKVTANLTVEIVEQK